MKTKTAPDEPKRDVAIVAAFNVSKQFLSDCLTGMAETCPEMCSWFGDEDTTIKRIKDGETWLKPLSVISIKGTYDKKEGNEGDRKGHATLDMPAVVLGLSRAITYPNIYDGLKGRILLGMANDDAGQIDSEAADVIAQLAIFGEVVYG